MSQSLTYRVRVGWEGRNSGSLVIGTGKVGIDTIGNYQFHPAYTGPYDDMTARVIDFQSARGRDTLLENIKAGQLTTKIYDPLSLFNPYNASSPLFGSVIPMRPCQWSAQYAGTWYDIFNGWLDTEQSTYDYGNMVATLHFQDLFLWLATDGGPTIASMGATTTGAAIKAVLAAYGLTDPALLSIDTGLPILDFSADGTKNGLTLIQDLLTAERGIFFYSASGVATYRNHNAWATKVKVGTIDAAQDVIPGVDLAKIKNSANVTWQSPPGSGNKQSYTDNISEANYGPRWEGAISTPYLTSDAQAALLAQYLVLMQKDALSPIWSYNVLETGNLPTILQADIGDWVGVTTSGVPGDYTVERIEHKGEGGKLHSVTWGFSARPIQPSPLIVGIGKVGIDHIGIY